MIASGQCTVRFEHVAVRSARPKAFVATQVNEVSVMMEVRGAQGVQQIPLPLKDGRNSIEENLDWTKIGVLNEVAFVVSPKSAVSTVKGSLSFALEFFICSI